MRDQLGFWQDVVQFECFLALRWSLWRGGSSFLVGFYSPLVLYKLAAPRQDFFLASICHANTDPPVRKIRLWASFGVQITTRCRTY